MRFPNASAWAIPRAVREELAWPCQRPLKFHSVSPWRINTILVISFIKGGGYRVLGLIPLTTATFEGILHKGKSNKAPNEVICSRQSKSGNIIFKSLPLEATRVTARQCELGLDGSIER